MSLILYVADVDAVVKRAVAAGATLLRAPWRTSFTATGWAPSRTPLAPWHVSTHRGRVTQPDGPPGRRRHQVRLGCRPVHRCPGEGAGRWCRPCCGGPPRPGRGGRMVTPGQPRPLVVFASARAGGSVLWRPRRARSPFVVSLEARRCGAALRLPAWSRGTARTRASPSVPTVPTARWASACARESRVRHADRDFSVLVAVNALGMRGPRTQRPSRPAETAQILLLGELVLLRVGGSSRIRPFAARLERTLTERVGPVEVLSAAVPGWSLRPALHLPCATRGLALEPDLVLLAGRQGGERFGRGPDLNRLTLGDDAPARFASSRCGG